MIRVLWGLYVWLRRGVLACVFFALALLALPLWNRTNCVSPVQNAPHASSLAPEHHHAEVDTLLTYPAFHITGEREAYAQTLRRGDPHNFEYLTSIAGYWSALCAITRQAGAHGGTEGRLRDVYSAGLGFTADMLVKAAYEETLGRVATWVRGRAPSRLDDLSAEQAALHAEFLLGAPWHAWDYGADIATLRDASAQSFRDWERRAALSVELGAKARLAEQFGSPQPEAQELRFVVRGIAKDDLSDIAELSVVETHANGIEVALTKRQNLTPVFEAITEAGGRFVDVAGNDDILFSATSNGPAYGAFHTYMRPVHGDRRHLFLVKVRDLARLLRSLEGRQLHLERIYPYG